jgi:hypothetical protein
VCGDGCFVAGTLVLTTLGAVPIEQLALGDHVLTSATALAQAPADEPYVRIAARFEHDGDVWDVELLRTQSWFEREVLLDHTFVLEISDTLTAQARVLDVQPAFLDADAPGSLVTGRFDHTSHNVYELVFEGSDAVVRTTGDHPFYSADRASFVPAVQLELGERVEVANGTLRLVSTRALEGTYRVYNLEVAGAHEYLVTSDGYRVHNYPDGAKGVADKALAGGKTSGAASEFVPSSGKPYHGVSGEVVPENDKMTAMLMATPPSCQSPYHGACSEIKTLEKALNDGVDVRGGVMETVNIGETFPGQVHGAPKAACSTCAWIMGELGVTVKK